jgi:DNA ligase-associated metallophosphoesterase
MAQPAASTGPIAAPALIGVMGVVMEAFPAGALWWADERLLIVADLHLEKGSSYARRGQMLPPYDTHETLTRLALLAEMLRPATVLALGDSFHDDDAPHRLNARDAATLAALQAGRDWVWLAGNHDPDLAEGLHGMRVSSLAIGRLTFRHEPSSGHADGEVAGHLHPAARVYGQGKSVRRRCFAGDGYRLVLPAFGAYAGGLDIGEKAFAGLFRPDPFRAFVLGEDRVYAVGGRSLRAR